MYNCENTETSAAVSAERTTIIMLIIMIISALSFVLGFVAGISITKKIYRRRRSRLKKTVTTDYGDFDADEYVRSLNFD